MTSYLDTRLGNLSRTGPYVQSLGQFNTLAELTAGHPANNYLPQTMAYCLDTGLMMSNGTTWVTLGAIPGDSELMVATYAAARLVSGAVTGDRLYALGRTTQSDGGQGLFTWVAGGSTTVDEGYVLQAVGGTWQRVDPSPEVGVTRLNAVWYNIKPANSDVTNDAGFAKLKAQMQTSGTTTWRVFFPPGAYTYTNNRWLWGVMRYILDAYDATFTCTNNDAFLVNNNPLSVGDIFQDIGDVPFPGSSTYANGYLFNTAVAGATTLTTTTAADAGNFTPGMRVLLHGYDQQGSGAPPNMRYFEYKTVLTAVAGTGVITFTERLAYAYDSRWWDTANYGGTGKAYGAPRILSMERANYKQPKFGWLKGATFLGNPNYAAGLVLQIQGDFLLFEDVQAPCFNAAESGTQVYRRCKFPGSSIQQSTGDKLIDRLVIEDSSTAEGGTGQPALTDCVGVNNLTILKSKFFSNINQIAPRNLEIIDCDILPATGTFAGITTESYRPIRSVLLQNTRVWNAGQSFGYSNKASPGFTLTVGTVVGTDIRITFDATGILVAQQIEYGMTLTNLATGNTGIITAIYYETGSPGTLRIAGTWSAPTAADVFNYYDVIQASDGGGNAIVGVQVPFWRGPPGPSIPTGTSIDTLTARLINFPKVAGTDIVDTTTGILFQQNSTNVMYVLAGGLLMQASADIYMSLGRGLLYSEGANGLQGVATLVAGTVTVATTKASTANSRILYSRHTTGGTVGHLSLTISNGVSFTITSSSATETSTIDWLIMNKQ